MGCDGGTIPTRDEVVKLKKKDQQLFDKEQVEYGKWFLCKLAQNQLCEPIVIDDLGNLFNKEKVLEALLDGSLQNSKSFSHIRSLKSIYDVKFTLNPAYEKDSNVSPWLCPITKIEVGSQNYKFKFIKSCGHVLSDKSFKELNNNSSTTTSTTSANSSNNSSGSCFLCSKEFSENDIIIINPNGEELEQMKLKLKEKLDSSKSSKKKKSSKKRNADSLNDSSSTSNGSLVSESSFTTNTLKQANEDLNKKMKSEAFSSIFKTNNKITTTTTTTTTTTAKSK